MEQQPRPSTHQLPHSHTAAHTCGDVHQLLSDPHRSNVHAPVDGVVLNLTRLRHNRQRRLARRALLGGRVDAAGRAA